jgi:Tfp pilus assembly protein PilF
MNWRTIYISGFFSAALLAPSAASAGLAADGAGASISQTAAPAVQDRQRTSRGFGYIRAGNPEKAIAEFDAVIAASDLRYLHDPRQRLCAGGTRSDHATHAASAPGAVLVDSSVCDAHFGKGFALVDMGRGDLAEHELRRATELAPFDAHYANEYAELYKSRRDWKTALALFTRAWDVAGKDPAGPDAGAAARALRGIGYSEMMLGNLEEAEKKFTQSLEFEPGNPAAGIELSYIARRKAIGS